MGRKRPSGVQQTGQSQLQLTEEEAVTRGSASPRQSSIDYLRGSSDTLPTFTYELTTTSLAQLENIVGDRVHPDQLEVHIRTPPSRRVAADGGESELEISRKTWSAYESLPRGLTMFGGGEVEEISDRDSQCSSEDEGKVQQEEIDTLDNDAYSDSLELEDLRRQMAAAGRNGNSRSRHLRPLPAFLQRASTISNTSSGSGYVISSLNSPVALTSPGDRDRTSCYSMGSDGYVINSFEWASSRPVPPVKPLQLPRIIEDSSASDYLHVLPS